jgi:hypothetical protein
MNPILRQIAHEAGLPTYNPEGIPTKLERFAELLVRECIEKITTYDLVPGHSAKWEDIYDIHTRLLQDLGQDLKEHFGVEE